MVVRSVATGVLDSRSLQTQTRTKRRQRAREKIQPAVRSLLVTLIEAVPDFQRSFAGLLSGAAFALLADVQFNSCLSHFAFSIGLTRYAFGTLFA